MRKGKVSKKMMEAYDHIGREFEETVSSDEDEDPPVKSHHRVCKITDIVGRKGHGTRLYFKYYNKQHDPKDKDTEYFYSHTNDVIDGSWAKFIK